MPIFAACIRSTPSLRGSGKNISPLARRPESRSLGTPAPKPKGCSPTWSSGAGCPQIWASIYVWNNIPEYTQRVVKGGEVVRTERIVAGEIGKQTPIFTRPMRRITFRPTWKVPEFDQGAGAVAEPAQRRRPDARMGAGGAPRTASWSTGEDGLDENRYSRIRGDPAKRAEKRDGKGEVLLPQPAHRFHARHAAAGQIDVHAVASELTATGA